jgi:Bacterial low temperature requirement A protein (LtrA)
VLLFSVTWYADDSFAWLTNALALNVVAYGLLLLEGMAGFLIIALAIPTTFEGGGVAFGVAYLIVIALQWSRPRPTSGRGVRSSHTATCTSSLVRHRARCGWPQERDSEPARPTQHL